MAQPPISALAKQGVELLACSQRSLRTACIVMSAKVLRRMTKRAYTYEAVTQKLFHSNPGGAAMPLKWTLYYILHTHPTLTSNTPAAHVGDSAVKLHFIGGKVIQPSPDWGSPSPGPCISRKPG